MEILIPNPHVRYTNSKEVKFILSPSLTTSSATAYFFQIYVAMFSFMHLSNYACQLCQLCECQLCPSLGKDTKATQTRPWSPGLTFYLSSHDRQENMLTEGFHMVIGAGREINRMT